MWEISLNSQLTNFLYSVILGLFAAVFYDIIKGFRIARGNSFLNTFLLDLLYFLLFTPVLFCFLIATTNGQLRGYILIGVIVGFLLFRYTISKFLFKWYLKILKKFFKLAVLFNAKINLFFDCIFEIGLKIFKMFSEIIKKRLNSFKKVLKKG